MTNPVDRPSWGVTLLLFLLGVAIGFFAALAFDGPILQPW